MATSIVGSSKAVQGTITLLSYSPDDNGTRLGCASEYFINGVTSNRDFVSDTTSILQASEYIS